MLAPPAEGWFSTLKENPVSHRAKRGLWEEKRKSLRDYSLDFRSLPAPNLTFFEALILIFAPVFGFTPIRALRCTTLKVPKPTSCTGLPFFRPVLIALMTASTARSACALLVSLPRDF